MKKIYFFVLSTLICAPAIATTNPMFDDGDMNSISLSIGQSTGNHNIGKLFWPGFWRLGPMNIVLASYAQPMEILRLPARVNVHIMQNIAYGSNKGLSFIGTGISWDVVPLTFGKWYVGAGIGPYYRDNHDRWVSSRLFFGEKVFIGRQISEHMRGEFFTLHFSNGDFTETNSGFNYFGFTLNYSF